VLVVAEADVCSVHLNLRLRLKLGKSGAVVERDELAIVLSDLASANLDRALVLEVVIDEQLDVSYALRGVTNAFVVVPNLHCRQASSFGVVEHDLKINSRVLRQGKAAYPHVAVVTSQLLAVHESLG